MDQDQRLNELVREFKGESAQYASVTTPEDREGKRMLLRSLMNIRMPRSMDPATIRTQDEYLRGRALEKGIVDVQDIPAVQEVYGSQHVWADRIALWQGDITRLKVDAIVNAANSQMLGCFRPMHNCIDNCIHTYAGIQLRAACAREMARLRAEHGADYEQPTAVPMLTDAYNLPAEKVVHIVGPIVYGPLTAELEQKLRECYVRTLDLCQANKLRSVAFCCISTGVFNFPADRAAEIAVETVCKWLDDHPDGMDRIVFNVFKDEDKRLYEEQLR